MFCILLKVITDNYQNRVNLRLALKKARFCGNNTKKVFKFAIKLCYNYLLNLASRNLN